ncbi:MAG TPA: isoprenylcysteine carboxylmethyltransferase family protein [Candidatus Acidoferrales bacterium]|jgi:protein-S-isoprenylcysteine O-methyltransferase Ste14
MILSLAVVEDFHGWSQALSIWAAVFPQDFLARLRDFGPRGTIESAWLVFGLYWLISSRGRKPARRREPTAERLFHVLWVLGATYLLYRSDPRLGALDRRFLPERLSIADLGAAITVAGVGLAIWARRHLGKNWSAEVTIREGHSLIRTGPYRYIRHPIYSGMLLGILGTAIAVGEYRGLAALAVFWIGWAQKARKEESFLAQEFGRAFAEHKRVTGFFLPRIG